MNRTLGNNVWFIVKSEVHSPTIVIPGPENGKSSASLGGGVTESR